MNAKFVTHMYIPQSPVQQGSLCVLPHVTAVKKTERTREDVCVHYGALKRFCNVDVITVIHTSARVWVRKHQQHCLI